MGLRKIFILLLVIVFFTSHNVLAYAYVLMPEYLCELGIHFYHQGRTVEALHEFNKALIISPGYEPALRYINIIQEIMVAPTPIPEPTILKPAIKAREQVIHEFLDKIEMGIPPVIAIPELEEEMPVPEVLLLDENINRLKFPLEIELGMSIIIKGEDIKRYLATQPDVLTVERISRDQILVTGKDIGYSYLHVWDENGRWTLEFLVTPPKPKGLTLDEEMRLAQERAGTFKLRYSINWSLYETGRRLNSLDRASYSYGHLLNLTGETPYGNLDSSVSVRTLKKTTDLTYLTLGLEKAKFGRFEDFSLRAFDYSPGVVNLAFSGASLRGAMLQSPAFNKNINYSVFWGREGGGRYGDLSPGLAITKDSFLSGFDLNLSPVKNQNYNFSLFRGWGGDRRDDLNTYGYDLDMDYRFDKWSLGYELAFDSQEFAHLLNLIYAVPKLRLTTELRDTAKDFRTMTGWGWRTGELGLLSTLFYTPFEKLSISSRLDVFQDRLYPNPEDEDRWNQNFNWDATYIVDPLTSLRLDFSLQNQLGRISQYRSYNEGIGLYKTFEFIKRINTFLNYRHQETKYYSSPTSNYINDKMILGLRFNIIGDLYYYLNKEFNWFQTRYTGDHSQPHVLETGVDWFGQIADSPFYGNLRFMFRDEEDTLAPLSFLSGEDYIEGYAELSYRPKPDTEGFLSARVRNVWADNPDVTKRVEANFYAGMRYLWDTGFRWESIGTVDGYVFKDFNSDGLRQKDEPPIEGIKLWLGNKKYSITDKYGYYIFTDVKAKRAYVNIDTTTIPSGYVLTVPVTQQVAIAHHKASRIDFGIVSRTEITGAVFEDVNRDGLLGPDDLGVRDVVLVLDDSTRITTDDSGRYFFRRLDAGKHSLSLDLDSLPTMYMPTVPIFKDIGLFEGTSYIYNIPLKKIEK